MEEEEKKRHDTDYSESSDEFLANLAELLHEQNDVDLAEILTIHLLTVAPTRDAVVNAKVAILKLASDRASPPEADND